MTDPTAPQVKMIGPSDADGTRDRLQDGQARLHPAAVDQDALHGFWYAETTDLLGAISGHHADDQTAAAADGDNDGDGAERVGIGRNQMDTESLVVEEVCERPNHGKQRQGDTGSDDANQNRQRHERQYGGSGREVPECPLLCVSWTEIAAEQGCVVVLEGRSRI